MWVGQLIVVRCFNFLHSIYRRGGYTLCATEYQIFDVIIADMTSKQKYWRAFFPQFVACPDNSVKSLMESANLVTLPAGETLFYPGKPCDSYVLLLEGKVKIQLLSENGREVLLYYVQPGDSCVLTTSCLLGQSRYPAEGISEAEVTAFIISSQAFHRCLEHSAFFREFVFQNFSSRLSGIIERMQAVVFGAIENRLCSVLLSSGEKVISKTHQELASESGSAREVISRHLKRFENYGWVSLRRGIVEIVDLDAIKRIADNPDKG